MSLVTDVWEWVSSCALGTLYPGILLVLATVYCCYLYIYRLYLDPLAKFPGPRLAALSSWYQGYYDCYLYGQYSRKINELHKRYGPIVRINPHELHVTDPEFIDELYAGQGKRRDKHVSFGRSVGLSRSTAATVPHDLHRIRRAAIAPYFSKASVRRLEPVISKTVNNILSILDRCKQNNQILSLTYAYKAATSDIICEYCFGTSTDYLLKEDFNKPFFDAVASTLALSAWRYQISWLGPLLDQMSPSIMGKTVPALAELGRTRLEWISKIERTRASESFKTADDTVFHGIFRSNLPPADKMTTRLIHEAQALVIAGQDTTATALSYITFHLLANPSILSSLRKELISALPDDDNLPTLDAVEKLPYLTAVIQEGLRLHPGATFRQTRVSPEEVMTYVDPSNKSQWTIPPGVPVSMDATTINMNAEVFPEPTRFIPDRWIENPKLEKYLMSFSKGTRKCLGMNLAYAELLLILAAIFRRYDGHHGSGEQGTRTLSLYDTTRERDVDMRSEMIVPVPAKESKGIRTTVH